MTTLMVNVLLVQAHPVDNEPGQEEDAQSKASGAGNLGTRGQNRGFTAYPRDWAYQTGPT